MLATPSKLNPAAAETLAKWHAMVEAVDMGGLPAISHPDVVFRSPVVFRPYPTPQAFQAIINAAMQVFEDFTYHRQFATEDGQSVVLEFSAIVGDKTLKGIDMIRFAEDGRIVEFEVMVRPMSGAQALGQAMAEKLGGKPG